MPRHSVHTLTSLLAERILVLDGATGTQMQALRLEEPDYRGERFARVAGRSQGPARHPLPDASGGGARHPPRLSRRGCRHHRDEHVQCERDLARRLRDGTARDRDQSRGGSARARRGGPRRARRRTAPLRRGRARPHEPDGLALTRRVGSRLPRGHVRRAAGRVPGRCERPDRGRCRPPDDRDHLRHAQRQGRDRGDRGRVRRARRAPAGDDLRHHHRPQRAHALGPDARGVLDLGRAHGARRGRAQLRARAGRAAAPPGGALARRERRHQRAPERRPAERPRRLRHGRAGDGRARRRPGRPTAC